jgi:hypothetical protein
MFVNPNKIIKITCFKNESFKINYFAKYFKITIYKSILIKFFFLKAKKMLHYTIMSNFIFKNSH